MSSTIGSYITKNLKLGYITKNLKLYSIAQKIKSDSLAWLNITCNPNAYSSAFSFNTFQSVVLQVFSLSAGTIYAGSVLAGICSYFGFKFYSVFSINLNCHPIQSLLCLQQHLFILIYYLFIYSCIHNHSTNIYWIPSLVQVVFSLT